jgi:hypothetical protein
MMDPRNGQRRKLADSEAVVRELMEALRKAGPVEAVRDADAVDDTPRYQLVAGSMRWFAAMVPWPSGPSDASMELGHSKHPSRPSRRSEELGGRWRPGGTRECIPCPSAGDPRSAGIAFYSGPEDAILKALGL